MFSRGKESLLGTQLSSALVLGISAIGVATLAAPLAEAQTQPTTGLYVGGALGANVAGDNQFENHAGNSTASYGAGFTGNLALGYGLGNGFRLELEPGYTNNSVDRVNGAPANSRLQMATVMGNVLYDFHQVQIPGVPLTPHIGVGIGDANVWDRSIAPSGNNVSGNTNRFAYQLIGGLDYSLTPQQKIGVDYRRLVVHNASFPTLDGTTAHAGDLDNNMFLATYRFEFNAPAAPPPPVPAAVTVPPAAPAPVVQAAHNYEVYFEFDRADLTPDARQVVQQAAQSARQGNLTHITATGHTDTVGSNSYNLALSRRRAEAVKAELVKNGISADAIAVNGVGENDLAVPTGPGVNEPRNRRVEITMQQPGA